MGRLVRWRLSRISFGGALMCRLVGHRWQGVATPCPQSRIESLRRFEGWICTRCPHTRLLGGSR